MTTIYICNWHEYQQQHDSSMTAKRQPDDTKQEQEEEGRIRNKYKVELSDTIRRVYDHFISSFGRNPNQYKLTDKRKLKIRQRLKDAGEEVLLQAITNTAQSNFHMGENDRGWQADLDFVIRSYEQVEKLANMDTKPKETVEFTL